MQANYFTFQKNLKQKAFVTTHLLDFKLRPNSFKLEVAKSSWQKIPMPPPTSPLMPCTSVT